MNAPVKTVAGALALARALGVDRLDAHVLLSHALAKPRTWLVAHDDAPLSAAAHEAAEALLRRRAEGVPLAYLTGEKEFHGLSLAVTPAVLVPRPDTETLVDWAIERVPPHGTPNVVDLGTGSGAIALAVKFRCPQAAVTAVDVNPEALAVARSNAERLELVIECVQSDWWQALAGRRYDLVLSNPPYVADSDPHLAGLAHEPSSALAAGPDGLDALRRLIAGAKAHMSADAWLLVEHGHDQGSAVAALMQRHGFERIEHRLDLAGRTRCSGGVLGAPIAV